MDAQWRRCSSCKTQLEYEKTYWVCNVSTCNRKRTGLVFCSVECWDAHLSSMNHRESWAEERTAPSRGEWRRELERQAAAAVRTRSGGSVTQRQAVPRAASQPSTTVVVRRASERSSSQAADSNAEAPTPLRLSEDFPKDILVVASRLKAYIQARSGMNTSDAVLRVLSDRLRTLCDRAIRSAHDAQRKTVLDRDFSG